MTTQILSVSSSIIAAAASSPSPYLGLCTAVIAVDGWTSSQSLAAEDLLRVQAAVGHVMAPLNVGVSGETATPLSSNGSSVTLKIEVLSGVYNLLLLWLLFA